MTKIDGFLPNFAPIQLEGFGSVIRGEHLFTLIHQGSLAGTEYFPSLIIRSNLKDASWSSVFVDSPIGFPKSTAFFSDRGQAFFFVDHDKENAQTRLPDGNWRGAYLNSVDIGTGKTQELPVNTQRRFWHDLKEVGGDLIALAFSSDFTLYGVNSKKSLLLPNVGSFSSFGNELIVSPYGGGNKTVSYVDPELLRVTRQFELASEGFVHETFSLTSLDGVKRALLFQEEFARSPHYIIEDEKISILDKLPNPRTIFERDLNDDGVPDLIFGTNEGTKYFLHDGYGRLLEVRIPELDGHFNVHPAESLLISFDWPSAAPRLNIQNISDISKVLTSRDALTLGLKPESFTLVPSETSLTIIQDSVVRRYNWDAFHAGSVSKADDIVVNDSFTVFPVHKLDNIPNTVSSIFIPTSDQSLPTLTLPAHILRVQTFDSFRAFDVEGTAGQAYRVYKAAFNRDPMNGDKAGLGYWISRIDEGMGLIEVSARFVDSDEFKSLYGTDPTNDQFLTKLYQNVLGRQPELLGYNWWLNELDTNPEKTKAKVLADFAESAENKAGTAQLVGQGIVYEPWVG